MIDDKIINRTHASSAAGPHRALSIYGELSRPAGRDDPRVRGERAVLVLRAVLRRYPQALWIVVTRGLRLRRQEIFFVFQNRVDRWRKSLPV